MADINAGDKVRHVEGGGDMTVKTVTGDFALVEFTTRDGEQAEKKFPLADLQKA